MEKSETWSERFEREFDAVARLLRRRPLLAVFFVGAMAFLGWHQFFRTTSESKKADALISPAGDLPSPDEAAVVPGLAAWMYVGTRIGDQWQRSKADGIEPPLTLDLTGLPTRGATYRVTRGVNLRKAAPVPQPDGARPPMADSKGTIGVGSIVKVDDFTQVEVRAGELRQWVWAHVTVVEAK